MTGFDVDIFKSFLAKCPIQYNLQKDQTGLFGDVINGSVTGAMGLVSNGAFVMNMVSYSMKPNRMTNFLWSRNHQTGNLLIVVKLTSKKPDGIFLLF
jgi:hypothetical protein